MRFPANFASTLPGGEIPPVLIAPFILLLLLIAAMPLTPPRLKHLWEAWYPSVAAALGLVVAGFYLVRVSGGGTVVVHALGEYLSFIVLIGSLFVVAGGIRLTPGRSATPLGNVVYLAVGAALANVIGTTGASMVLIRPWIQLNHSRVRPYHIVFFIFLVSNIGGALTPIGDPPLFLGYLRGVPFFWLVTRVLGPWSATLGALLAIFYALDFMGQRRAAGRIEPGPGPAPARWSIEGAGNLIFLGIIVGAVFLPENYLLREAVMLAAAVASFGLTPRAVHVANRFGFGPIKEVAWLFLGIFLTMIPALGYLSAHGREFGFIDPVRYYFATGTLSSILDNAPTYANLLQLAQTTATAPDVPALLAAHPSWLIGISLGSVFFGAMTYIGNGPNFMVKAIAEDAGVACPGFFGYIFKYSLPLLLPVLALVGWWLL